MKKLIKNIGSALRMAMDSVRSNILRTALSLTGVCVGVFTITGIFTLVDSIESNVEESFGRFGNNIVLVQKWPWEFSSDYPFWKYEAWPEIRYEDFLKLEKNIQGIEAMSFNSMLSGLKLQSGRNSLENVTARTVTHDYAKVLKVQFLKGRYFTIAESEQGAKVMMLGYEVAKSLFGQPEMAVGRQVKTMARTFTVIGVHPKEGKALGIGGDIDRLVTIPFQAAREITTMQKPNYSQTIFVKGLPGQSIQETENQIRGAMRAVRKLSPKKEDNFALNKITLFMAFLDSFFAQVSFGGMFIAGFSILVGGFGIANIMFVSVKERTAIIGIQKALGAKNYVILIQFLSEAILLCLCGGFIGLLLIGLGSKVASEALDLKIALTMKNILIGVGTSSMIGLLAGFLPAYRASQLDPIQSIRTGQ